MSIFTVVATDLGRLSLLVSARSAHTLSLRHEVILHQIIPDQSSCRKDPDANSPRLCSCRRGIVDDCANFDRGTLDDAGSYEHLEMGWKVLSMCQ